MKSEIWENIIRTTFEHRGLEKSKAAIRGYEKMMEQVTGKMVARGYVPSGPAAMAMRTGMAPSGKYTATGDPLMKKGKILSYTRPFMSAEGKEVIYSGEMARQGAKGWKEYSHQLGGVKKVIGNTTKATHGLLGSQAKLALRAAAVIPIWMALRTVFMSTIQALSSGISFWRETEDAMAEIRIVGKGTEEQYKSLKISILEFSRSLGISAVDSLKAAKLFAQQGLTIAQTIDMTRVAMIGAQVLSLSVTKVANNLTAATRAYNIETSESITLIDKWMRIQRGFAVTATDLGEATQRASAVASAFGISYEKFLGHITAMIEITRRTGNVAGRSLQMIYTRLFTTGRKAVQEIAKVPVFLTKTGEVTTKNTHIFRSAEEVLDELALAYTNLNRAEKINVAVKVGSRRQATPFLALMKNYTRALEAQIAAYTSAGETMRDFAIKQDTVSVRITQMQNAWLQLSDTLSQTGAWKNILGYVESLADGLLILINRSDAARLAIRQNAQANIDLGETYRSQYQNALDLLKMRERLTNQLKKATSEEVRTSIKDLIETVDKSLAVAGPATRGLIDVKNLEDSSKAMEGLKRHIDSINKETIIRNKVEKEYDKLIEERNKLIEKYGEKSISIMGFPFAVKEKGKDYEADKKRIDEINQKIEKQIELQYGIVKGKEKEHEVNELIAADKDNIERDAKEEMRYQEHIIRMMRIRKVSEGEILNYLIKQWEFNERLKNSEEAATRKEVLKYQLLERKERNRINYLVAEEQAIIDIEIAKRGISGVSTREEEIGIEMELVKQSNLLLSADGKRLKILELQKELIIVQLEKATRLAETLKASFEKGLSAFFRDEGNISDIFKSMSETWRKSMAESLAEGVTKQVFDVTKMGSLFAKFGIMFETGAEKAARLMYNAHTKGGAQAARMVSQAMSGAPITGGGTGMMGMGGGIGLPGFGASGIMGKPMWRSEYGVKGGKIGPAAAPVPTFGQGLGAVGGAGMAAYGAYQRGGTMAGVMGGVGAGMMGMGALGMGAAFLGPLGLAIGIATMTGMFDKSKSWSKTETKEQTNQVTSKLDITNAQLKIVNRNLVALKEEMTFTMPSSFYFSEEDKFSINSRRG